MLWCGLLNVDGIGDVTFENVKSAMRQKSPDLVVLLETMQRAED